MSWSEAKWIVDNVQQKVGQTPSSMRSFSASPLTKNSIGLKFLEAKDTYVDGNLVCAVNGVMIRMSETGYPKGTGEGTLVVDNKDLGKYENTPFVVDGLQEGKKYYFSAFPYSSQGVYNLDNNLKNQAESTPKDGEKANVTLIIDNASGFNSVTVTCVDETNGSMTKSVTLTPTKTTTSFTIPIGDTYHIEYGEVDGYFKPENTEPKVSVSGESTDYEANYYYFTSTINVTYPAGATLTCECGAVKYTADTTTGNYTFEVHSAGTWTVTATDGSNSESKQVVITESWQTENIDLTFAKIYGIMRTTSSSSPAWTRTDKAVGMTATASVGTVAGSSDFDNIMPWQGIVRETLSTGEVMVKIPKFYYLRYAEGNVEYIKISAESVNGFKLHPAFKHAGVETDYIYVGAYKTSNSTDSLPGKKPFTNKNLPTIRNLAKGKGFGWGLVDMTTVSAIQMLIMVEFANNNVQTVIGRGYSDYNTSVTRITGTCDKVPNLTGRPSGTSGLVDVVWRGIEGFWGSIYEYVDGFLASSGKYYYCNDPSKYGESVTSDYTKLSMAITPPLSGWITKLSVDVGDNAFAMLPVSVGGSESTYYCDQAYYPTGTTVTCYARAGLDTNGSSNGLFNGAFHMAPTTMSSQCSSRLQLIPVAIPSA